MTHRYIGTKEIVAWEQVNQDGEIGYAVKYADGYTSWSPKDVFEAAYRTCEPGMPQSLTFGDALHFLKQGKKVARAGWNGKNMWLTMTAPMAIDFPHNHFHSEALDAYAQESTDGFVRVNPSIAMKTADGSLCIGWLASQADMLSADWCVL